MFAKWIEVDGRFAFTFEDTGGCIEVSDAEHAALFLAQSKGATIKPDANGYPIAVFPPTPTIDQIKAAKNEEINRARLSANSTTFSHAGKTFACDVLSRGDIDAVANHIGLFEAFPPSFPGGWKAIDNTVFPMQGIDDFKAFYQSMTAQGTANFNHAQQLKAQLAEATTIDQINAIAW